MNSVEMQIECSKKLGVPEKKIAELCKKYFGWELVLELNKLDKEILRKEKKD